MKTPLLIAVVIGVLILTLGCVPQTKSTTSAGVVPAVMVDNSKAVATASAQVYPVALDNGNLMPTDVEIRAGESVQWVNKDDVRYTLLFSGSEERLPIGGTFEHQFNELGRVQYTAVVVEEDQEDHQERQLHGIVIVN